MPVDGRVSRGGLTVHSSTARRQRSSRARSDWRLGGRGVHRWDGVVLATALFSCGVAVIASGWVGRSFMPWAPALSVIVLWMGLGLPAVLAFSRGVPARLLTFHASDLLWASCIGLALRILQGMLSDANSSPFPSFSSGAGTRDELAGLTFRVASGLVSPLFEEFFFRGVLLVALYQMLRRPLGFAGAGAAATVASVALFVCLHLFFEGLSGAEVTQLAFVGFGCACYTLATGRLWGAVLIHLIYNASFFGLMALGTV